jgi:hypothetical protein
MTENPVATADQLQAEHYAALFLQMAQREAHRFGQLIASRPDHQLLGATEFDLRKLLHDVGAAFLEAALNERKKGATEVPAKSVRTAHRTPT